MTKKISQLPIANVTMDDTIPLVDTAITSKTTLQIIYDLFKTSYDSVYASISYADSKVADAINNGTTTIAPSQNAVYDALALKEDISNKSTDVTTDGASNTKYPSVKSVKDYVDTLVSGLLDYRGSYNASGNTFPASGGSGTAGAVLKGDMWIISVAGTLGGSAVQIGDSVIANIDTPGQTAGNWNILNSNIAYVPEDVANKSTSVTTDQASNTKYPSVKSVYDWVVSVFASIASPTFTGMITTPLIKITGGSPGVGKVLTSDANGQADWQTPSSGTFKGCRVKQSAAQSIGNTLTAVVFDAETFDTDTMHDTVTNNTRITFNTAGYYQISGIFNTDANAVAQVGIRLNGSTYIFLSSVGNAGASLANGVTIASIYQYSASDYIEVMGYFGTTQNTKTGENGTHVAVAKLG